MAKVIIYTGEGGNVHVCVPTDDYLKDHTIEEVKAKDCPPEAIIVDDSILPQGENLNFFDAWELNENTITVNFSKAQAIKLKQYNLSALTIANQRNLNNLAGIENTLDDASWIAKLTADRNFIASATNIEQLMQIENPT